MDLFAAIARRDAAGIVRLGNGLLTSVSALSDGDLAYLTTVIAAAYVNLGDTVQAHALLVAHRSSSITRAPSISRYVTFAR